jgi:hypothetical protein
MPQAFWGNTRSALANCNLYYVSFAIRMTATPAANSEVFGMVCPPGPGNIRSIRILSVALNTAFDGTPASSTQFYQGVRWTGSSTVASGTDLVAASAIGRMLHTEPVSIVTQAQMSTGAAAMTVTGAAQYFLPPMVNQPRALTTASVRLDGANLPHGYVVLLEPGEAFSLRISTTAVIGDVISGTVTWDEGLPTR